MEEDFLEQTRDRDIDLIVVSDSEAILGIGGTHYFPTILRDVLTQMFWLQIRALEYVTWISTIFAFIHN